MHDVQDDGVNDGDFVYYSSVSVADSCEAGQAHPKHTGLMKAKRLHFNFNINFFL